METMIQISLSHILDSNVRWLSSCRHQNYFGVQCAFSMLYNLQAAKTAPKQFAEMKQILIEKYCSLNKCKHVLRNKPSRLQNK